MAIAVKKFQLVQDVLHEVMRENDLQLVPLGPDTRILEDTPLDSLQLAVALVKLEERTGKDPFTGGFVRFSTVAELAALYE